MSSEIKAHAANSKWNSASLDNKCVDLLVPELELLARLKKKKKQLCM